MRMALEIIIGLILGYVYLPKRVVYKAYLSTWEFVGSGDTTGEDLCKDRRGTRFNY